MNDMEYRQLGRSGLRVSALTLGTMTFGGRGMFANVGTTDVKLATRQIDQIVDAGVNLVDTADVYSDGLAEEILGEALAGPSRPPSSSQRRRDSRPARARTTPASLGTT